MIIDRPNFLWISASPSLKYFHRRLLNHLSKVVKIEFWEYHQTLDENSSIDEGVKLLHTYLSTVEPPTHLIGHGISGTIALRYAQMHPTKVASLTLLSVAVQPAINWHSYYYNRLWSLQSSRQCVLKSISTELFPDTCARHICDLVDRMERDLVESPSSHSLFRSNIFPASGVDMPMMICTSQADPVIPSYAACEWNNYLKSADKIWRIPTGGHFFHHVHSELVNYQIRDFWQKLVPDVALYELLKAELN
jgi:pimeloyl-ACP methyl ester carboxylesterase